MIKNSNGIITNLHKKISFKYSIKKTYESGIVLFGWEVKAIKHMGLNITSSYILINNFNCWLVGSITSNIITSIYNDKKINSRNRKLLFHKKEIKNLTGMLKIKGFTLIPSKVYWKNSFIKLEICLASGKKKYDKRIDLATRQWNLDKLRILKNQPVF